MSKQPPPPHTHTPAPTASAIDACPTIIQIVERRALEVYPLHHPMTPFWLVGWLFWVDDPLRQYFSLYRVLSQREGERRERIEESKNVQTTPSRTYCKRSRPLPYYHPNCRTPRHWKFTQDHRTTRPPLPMTP